MGGTVTSGTYYATSAVFHNAGGGCAGYNYRERLDIIASSPKTGTLSNIAGVGTDTNRQSFSYSTAGTLLTATGLCGTSSTVQSAYSATPTTLSFIRDTGGACGVEVVIYTKQP
jgi:hypothetical protein